MRSSTVPARVSQSRSRSPLRCTSRSGDRSPWRTPVLAPINRSAAKPIISRKISASGVFSTNARRFIISSVIGGSSVALRFATRPYRRIANDRRNPLARYGAMGSALRERLAPAELHQQAGHHPAHGARDREQPRTEGRSPRAAGGRRRRRFRRPVAAPIMEIQQITACLYVDLLRLLYDVPMARGLGNFFGPKSLVTH